MLGSNYMVTYDENCAILSARIKGKFIPLISNADRLQVENIYHNILTGAYKNARELCEDISNNFSIQATLQQNDDCCNLTTLYFIPSL